jgi:hypothetical protein
VLPLAREKLDIQRKGRPEWKATPLLAKPPQTEDTLAALFLSIEGGLLVASSPLS